MAEPTFSFCELRAFRAKLHASLTRRTDALLELADAVLCAPAIPSLAHLSLEAVHQRGWGSTYAARPRPGGRRGTPRPAGPPSTSSFDTRT